MCVNDIERISGSRCAIVMILDLDRNQTPRFQPGLHTMAVSKWSSCTEPSLECSVFTTTLLVARHPSLYMHGRRVLKVLMHPSLWDVPAPFRPGLYDVLVATGLLRCRMHELLGWVPSQVLSPSRMSKLLAAPFPSPRQGYNRTMISANDLSLSKTKQQLTLDWSSCRIDLVCQHEYTLLLAAVQKILVLGQVAFSLLPRRQDFSRRVALPLDHTCATRQLRVAVRRT